MKISFHNENFIPLLDNSPNAHARNKLAEKCREFEAVFVKKMLEVGQPKDSLFGSGMRGDFYRDFYLDELAKEITKNPGIGLAESMYRALNRNSGELKGE